MSDDLVIVKGKQAICTSLQIAESFNKEHKDVLEAIRNLMAENCAVKNWFYLTTRKVRGREFPVYEMNRDGFTLLAMGFTGVKATEWKVKYIEAFNRMEMDLSNIYSHHWLEEREKGKIARKAETDMIQRFVEYAEENGSDKAKYYYVAFTNLANKFAGISSKQRDTASINQLSRLEMMENIIMHCIDEGLVNNTEYHQVYQNTKKRLDEFMEIAYLTEK